MIDLGKAIKSLYPNAIWVLRGNEYSGIEWIDTKQTKPTENELVVEATRLQAKELANEYKAKRAAEYPPVGDQLDALWKGGSEAEAMLAKVQAVKQKFPKGAN